MLTNAQCAAIARATLKCLPDGSGPHVAVWADGHHETVPGEVYPTRVYNGRPQQPLYRARIPFTAAQIKEMVAAKERWLEVVRAVAAVFEA